MIVNVRSDVQNDPLQALNLNDNRYMTGYRACMFEDILMKILTRC
jgi:hypothetical protein